MVRTRNKQVEEIFHMMQDQEEKFGKTSMEDLRSQMKFYCG